MTPSSRGQCVTRYINALVVAGPLRVGCLIVSTWHSRLRNSFLIWVRIRRLYIKAATSPEDVVGIGVPDDYSDPQPRSMAKIYFTLRGEITASLPLALLENLDKNG